MKPHNRLATISLPFLLVSCAALGGGVEGADPAQAAGDAAGTVATIATGNPLIGAGIGALVTGVAALFVAKRKKAKAAT